MEIRKPFNYKEHVLPLVADHPTLPQITPNPLLKPLQLEHSRAVELKGVTRLSNYEFLNELKSIQAEGMAER